jgi:uncharacterized protein with NAD-binding domain and iron-sulfur cluster
MGQPTRRKRVVILGGGPSALSAAYHLTSREPDSYDITIYEMSWRLGGKTASGRGEYERIEEHGLHVLFGAYHNAFDLMLDCYDRLAEDRHAVRDQRTPRHFFDAVEPRHFGVIGDDQIPAHEDWVPWYLQFPCNWRVPGDPPMPTAWDLFLTLLQLVVHVFLGALGLRVFQSWFRWLVGYKRKLPRTPKHRLPPEDAEPPESESKRALGGSLVTRLAFSFVHRVMDEATLLGRVFKWFVWRAHYALKKLRWIGPGWTVLDFAFSTLKGMIAHGFLVSNERKHSDPRGQDPDSGWGYYDRIDNFDFRHWLAIFDAEPATLESPFVRIVYDAAFSYEDGGLEVDVEARMLNESMGAGTVLRIMMLMGFTYKHAMYYKMRGGMGDIISAPLYQVLKSRGVKFEFFHRVVGLRPGKDREGRDVIAGVEIEKLVRLKPVHSYEPLVPCRGLMTWPSKPRPEAIDPAWYPAACNVEKSYMSPRQPPAGGLTLTASDFDKLIFAIPVACIPYICKDLVAAGDPASPAYDPGRAHFFRTKALGTVQTVALQIWFRPQLERMGWAHSPPLLSLFFDPLNTWCDMSQTLMRENWPEGLRPGTVAYFCGPLPHRWPLPTPERAAQWGAAEFKQLHDNVDRQVNRAVGELIGTMDQLVPNVRGPTSDPDRGFNFSLILDPQRRQGDERLLSCHRQANFEPSARCTLALPGETEWRIHAGATGYQNLVVAGDWTRNGLHAACFEGAVVSGIYAARATTDLAQPARRYPVKAEALFNLEPPTSAAS